MRARLRAMAAAETGSHLDPTPEHEAAERVLAAERRRRGGTAALALLLALGASWFVLQVLRGPDPAPLELVPGAAPAAAGTGAGPVTVSGVPSATAAQASAAPPQTLVVHVMGDVRRPGLVRLAPGSRVADAIEAAGGLVRGGGSGSLNLARPVVDGEQVVVSEDADAEPGPPPGSPGAAAPGPIDLNTATPADLDTLPGVGPVLASRILAWREAHGRFATVDQLAEVPGIGERTLERLAPLVRV